MSVQAQYVDGEAAEQASAASEFPMYVAPQPSDNADILDPEFPGEGSGRTCPNASESQSAGFSDQSVVETAVLCVRENSDA